MCEFCKSLNMKKFSLEPEERGIILRADTEIGPMRLDINTGATVSLVRSSLFDQMPNLAKKLQKDWRGLSYFVTNVLVDSTALGWQKMYPVDISEDIVWADGCLGADFLDKHIVYIDYPNKKVYIS